MLSFRGKKWKQGKTVSARVLGGDRVNMKDDVLWDITNSVSPLFWL